MDHIGQDITWGTLTAPAIFTGKCTGYTFADAVTPQRFDDEAGDFVATVRHSRKAQFNLSAEVTVDTVDFIDLSAGAIVAIPGTNTGAACGTQAVESWRLQQRKTASLAGTWYPDIVPGAAASAGVALNAFTPDQSGLSIVSPAAVIIYGTYGITHTSGIVHELTITQELRLVEDDPSPAGTILGVTPVGYMRSIRLLLLLEGALPAVKSTLTLTGAPDHAAGYTIDSVEKRFGNQTGLLVEIGASWIPADAA